MQARESALGGALKVDGAPYSERAQVGDAQCFLDDVEAEVVPGLFCDLCSGTKHARIGHGADDGRPAHACAWPALQVPRERRTHCEAGAIERNAGADGNILHATLWKGNAKPHKCISPLERGDCGLSLNNACIAHMGKFKRALESMQKKRG